MSGLIKRVACGGSFSLVLKNNNELLLFGGNEQGGSYNYYSHCSKTLFSSYSGGIRSF